MKRQARLDGGAFDADGTKPPSKRRGDVRMWVEGRETESHVPQEVGRQEGRKEDRAP